MAVTSRWTLFSILVITWTCFSWVETYPSGAPVSTCGDMVPRHLDFQPQRSPPPYFLQPSTLNVKSGNKIKVMLSSQRDASFVGFMVQARALSGGGDPIGGFTNLPDITKAITCGSSPMVCICLSPCHSCRWWKFRLMQILSCRTLPHIATGTTSKTWNSNGKHQKVMKVQLRLSEYPCGVSSKALCTWCSSVRSSNSLFNLQCYLRAKRCNFLGWSWIRTCSGGQEIST